MRIKIYIYKTKTKENLCLGSVSVSTPTPSLDPPPPHPPSVPGDMPAVCVHPLKQWLFSESQWEGVGWGVGWGWSVCCRYIRSWDQARHEKVCHLLSRSNTERTKTVISFITPCGLHFRGVHVCVCTCVCARVCTCVRTARGYHYRRGAHTPKAGMSEGQNKPGHQKVFFFSGELLQGVRGFMAHLCCTF